MQITYFGLSSFKFTIKSAAGIEYSLVTDPFNPTVAGIKTSRIKTDIVISSNPASDLHGYLASVKAASESELRNINSPGEYEMNDIFVQGVVSVRDTIFYYVELEKIKIAFLGSYSGEKVTSSHMEVLENCDILVIPIGGGEVSDIKQASAVVTQLEPRVVIPAFYKIPGLKVKGVANTPDQLFKELGVRSHEETSKLKITAKDLPQEELKGVWMKM